MTYEELLQQYIDFITQGEQSLWNRAVLATAAVRKHKLKPAQFASDVGCSASLVRKLVKTFEAFPEESTRACDLSFEHHAIAANTKEPEKWLSKAAENAWSTREMKKAVNGKAIKKDYIKIEIGEEIKIKTTLNETETKEYLKHALQAMS